MGSVYLKQANARRQHPCLEHVTNNSMIGFRLDFHKRQRARVGVGCLIVVLGLAPARPCQADDASPQRQALGLLLTGNYAEAEDAYRALATTAPLEAAIGLARVAVETGAYDEAEATLRGALQDDALSPRLQAELAALALRRGAWDMAREQLTPSTREVPLARWVQAELCRLSGKLDEAERAYRRFIEAYNTGNIDDAEHLLLIGKAAAMYARWNRTSDQFRFLVNELYPDIARLEPNCWRAHFETGMLYLEKFNQPDAARAFERALAINPQAAEVHAAKAHLALQRYDIDTAEASIARALAIDPNLLAARLARADLKMMNFDAAGAAEYLEAALPLNPRDEETLGRLAAAYIVLDRHRPDDRARQSGRVTKLIDEVLARNSAAGVFFYTLGTRLEERRRFDVAIHYLQRAEQCMPRLIGPQAALGMLYMRLGQEAEAKQALDAAFAADPFNVRVNNALQVLEVLEGYETLETEHFVIRFDSQKDRVLARYAARHLEEVYPELCTTLGFEPPEKSLIEIFNRARNSSGHSWFSARAVGVPYVRTVGACTGKMVAMTSPNEGERRFNWARVLEHEFVHVINLQQTNFNIPHWFTEALAVWNEGYPRPADWSRLLRKRLAAGKIFDLDSINLGFIRPESSDDWQLAYCQAELYAEYLLARFGDEAPAKMLAAYADDLDTRAAITKCFGIDQAEFERGYRTYLMHELASPGAAPEPAERSEQELQRLVKEQPDRADARAEWALRLLKRNAEDEARAQAERALAIDPRQGTAAYVLARLRLAGGDAEGATKLLAAVQSPDRPHRLATSLLASLALNARQFGEAERLYRLLAEHDREETQWVKGLAKVALVSQQEEPLAEALAKLAELEPDDPVVRKKLAELALRRENYREGARWARRALEIDVLDASTHRMLGQALLELGQTPEAIEEFGVAVELAPDDAGLRYLLADACVQGNDDARARQALTELLQRAPDYPGAKQMLETLRP